ncbi:LysR family transcriptional regulator [Luteibacter sp. SG786]|uniref:LysR family transcriptional regulator n=1 Tax=Luteibacter sp. SG786 TaxID=2587130 RepID=UPI001422D009|nr:LysR family transcriptional regulator [Luteibacter sp. SG786]NII56354.1 DNA-binding transcriptional LysR family regulator [Luteibacter sp. SG786]
MNVPMPSHPPLWDDLRVLLAVHRGKSFFAAGKALEMATSTVARRVQALERALDRPLVQRRSMGATIEADALGLIALAEHMELELEASRRAPDIKRVTGTVRVSAPEGFSRQLTRMLARVQDQHPGLAFELTSESRLVDLGRREADIAVRIARTTSAAVIEKFMGQARVAVFAARSYVERRLPGARLASALAAQHDWIALDRTLDRLPTQQWMSAYGATRFAVRSTSPTAIEEALVAGMGLGILGEAQGAALGLLRIETETIPPPVDVFLAFHREQKNVPRIRVVLRELETEIRHALA